MAFVSMITVCKRLTASAYKSVNVQNLFFQWEVFVLVWLSWCMDTITHFYCIAPVLKSYSYKINVHKNSFGETFSHNCLT